MRQELSLILAAAIVIAGCGGDDAATTTTGGATSRATGAGGGAGGAGGGEGTGGGIVATPLDTLESFLLGDFDNSAQHDAGFSKLVERHVCAMPGRDGDPAVVWLYVEHVEDLANDTRDAYFTRVNEIRMEGTTPVSKAYKFAAGHPLETNAFAFNGPRDGCFDEPLLAAITDADLVYRDGCDVTFTPQGDTFHATTPEGTCTFPGGYIQTTAEVFADGMDVQDEAVTGGTKSGDLFEFRRVSGFMP